MSVEVCIEVFGTTGRDGAQSMPKNHQFPDGSKVDVADQEAWLGLGVIEAGFPKTPFDAEEVAAVSRTVGQTSYDVVEWVDGIERASRERPPVIAGLCRVRPDDIEVGWASVVDADRPRIHTFVSTDDFHRENRFPGASRDDLVEMARKGVAYARAISDGHPGASVEFSAEAASTTDMRYLERVVKTAIDEGAHIINVPDTVGQRDPMGMFDYYNSVIDWVMVTNPGVTISAHNHNDLGMAVANTITFVQAAAAWARFHQRSVKTQLETTICGLGERAGNADVFPVVAGLFKFAPEMPVPVRWQFNPWRSVEVAQTVMGLAGLEVDRQNPVVGSDILRHRSGIHSDGVLKGGHRMYTPFAPKFWGHRMNAIHEDGKYQGKAGAAAASAKA